MNPCGDRAAVEEISIEPDSWKKGLRRLMRCLRLCLIADALDKNSVTYLRGLRCGQF